MVYDVHMFGLIIDTREIFISSNLNESIEDSMIDHVVFSNFIKNLRILNSIGNDPILIHLGTCGGDWNYGIAIYDAIKESCDDENSSDIIVLSHASARSMSSVIPQAASLRIIMPNADYLVHYGSSGYIGNHRSFVSEAQQAEESNDTMLQIYVNRIKNSDFFINKQWTEKQIMNWLKHNIDKKQEFYMTAREAVEKGFADAVLGDKGYESIDRLR